MPVVAVVNQKGGCGKTTIATHLAAYLSLRQVPVLLADMDPQHSTGPWLAKRRGHQAPGVPIVGLQVDGHSALRHPHGVKQVIVDTPGGLHGVRLSRVLMSTAGILMPVCDSAFDRESSAAFLAELRSHPGVASGRIPLAAIGMRVDARTHGEQHLQEWAQAQQVPLLGVLRSSQIYVRCIERGLTIFDVRESLSRADLLQWRPVLEWLAPVLSARGGKVPADTQPAAYRPPVIAPSRLGGPHQLSGGDVQGGRAVAPEPIARPSVLAPGVSRAKGLRGLFDRWLSNGPR